MKNKFKILLITAIVFLFITPLCACSKLDNKVLPSELKLKIDLDIGEEIGLFIIDWQLGEESGSGGIANSDKTMIAPDETLYFSLDKSQFENTPQPFDLTLSFIISDEYFEPNFDNAYPEEALSRLKPVSFEASFGNEYEIAVSGNRDEGYEARLL